jgi:apolipoprotein N-acyltransferase
MRRGSAAGASLATLLALLSGALLAWAGALHPFWAAAWLAPVPVLWFLIRDRRHAFGLGAIAGLAGSASVVWYYAAIAGPLPTAIILSLRAVEWGLIASASATAFERLAPELAVLAYPVALAGLETVVVTVSPHGTAGSLANSQMTFLPVLQAAALGGAPAVTFLVALFGSSLAALLARPRKAVRAVLGSAAALAAMLAWGAARAASPAGASVVKIAMVSTDAIEHFALSWSAAFDAYWAGVEEAIARGARVVVLPEKIARLGPKEARDASAELAGIARARGVDLVVGVEVDDGDRSYNRALVAQASGEIATYDKRHPVPGWESRITPGRVPLVLDLRDGRMGVAICKDMDFVGVGRETALAGARVILVPGWDFHGAWGTDGWAHGRLAVLRGVEAGATVIRSPRVGLLVASDRFGRVIAETPSRAEPTVLVADVPVPDSTPTVYARLGDLFGWSCVGAFALIMLGARKRSTIGPSWPRARHGQP